MRLVIRLAGSVGLIGASALIFSAAAAAQREVTVRDNMFEARTIEIDVGDSVLWRHDGGNPHSVTAHAGQAESFDSHPNCSPFCMQSGDTFEHTFDNAGTFTYYCKVHGSSGDPDCAGMCGRVGVSGAPPPPPPPPAPTQQPAATRAPAATLKPSPTPTLAPTATATPSVTALAVIEDESETGGRGPVIGLAIAAVLLAAGGGLSAWRRFGAARG